MSECKVSKIKFNGANEVQEFCIAAEKCDFDINIFYPRNTQYGFNKGTYRTVLW